MIFKNLIIKLTAFYSFEPLFYSYGIDVPFVKPDQSDWVSFQDLLSFHGKSSVQLLFNHSKFVLIVLSNQHSCDLQNGILLLFVIVSCDLLILEIFLNWVRSFHLERFVVVDLGFYSVSDWWGNFGLNWRFFLGDFWGFFDDLLNFWFGGDGWLNFLLFLLFFVDIFFIRLLGYLSSSFLWIRFFYLILGVGLFRIFFIDWFGWGDGWLGATFELLIEFVYHRLDSIQVFLGLPCSIIPWPSFPHDSILDWTWE